MSIDSISPSSNPYQANDLQTQFLQIRKNFEQLGQALKSGDMRGAQTAFSSLQQLLPVSSVNQAQAAQQINQSAFSANFDALGQALQTGDLSKAQEAFLKLQQDAQAAQKGHHHHHHHKTDSSQNAVYNLDSSTDSSKVSSSDSESGTNIDVTT